MQRVWVRETAGWICAAALAISVAAQVAASARSTLLFRDGDSLVVAMLSRSVQSGEPLDWALSSVLFLPESAVFTALDALLPLDLAGLLAVNAVLNLLAVYGALRLVAGRQRPGFAPVTWSLVALALFGVLATTETSPSRDALELASLQLTTTYYASTVVAVVLVVGVLRRALDRERGSISAIVAIGGVSAIATLSNPLFAAWGCVPVAVLLMREVLRRDRRRLAVALLAALIAGAAVGFLGRIPFSAWIANSGAGYARPNEWAQSLAYYADLLGDRLSTPSGLLGSLLTVALLAVAIARTVRADDPAARLVAVAGWLIPVLVVIGAIALGTHAARYLQPVAFAPLLAVLAAPRGLRVPPRLARQVSAGIGVLLLVAAGLSIPRLDAAAHAPDPELSCVVDWVDASGRTGAGQFWTVRLPKAHLEQPGRLVQVDHRLNGYAWLVNRADFEAGEVSFLVEDDQTVQWDLQLPAVPGEVVQCGRYRILDFAPATLPLGPAHS